MPSMTVGLGFSSPCPFTPFRFAENITLPFSSGFMPKTLANGALV